MPYVHRVVQAGRTVEHRKMQSFRVHTKGVKRGPNKGTTTERQARINERVAEEHLRWDLNGNFDHWDLHAVLHYYDKDTTFEEYTTIELLSVSMLIVISTFALDFIHSDRSIFKIVDLDEAWAFLNVAQGETLSNKLVRAGRAMQAGVYFVTQSSGDVSKESLKNNIGLKFAFRSTDINEIKQTLEFFGIDKDDENNQKRLRDLENGQCLLQDLYGRVGVVQIHPVFEELLHAFDTRPPVQRNEVE